MMKITYIGHNHTHDMDFEIQRPHGSGDYLALLLKSHGLFLLNNQPVVLPPNTFFLYQQGTPQYYKAYMEPFSNDWFHFTLEDDETDFFESLQIPFETPISLHHSPFFSLLIKHMTCEYYTKPYFYNQSLDHYLSLFFIKISEAYQTYYEPLTSLHINQLVLLRSKIYSRPYEKWTVEGLAHEINLSPYYFQKLYKKQFNISCLKDIINARIEYAKHYLTLIDIPIKSIAENCGYENDVHFMRQFKSVTTYTPSEYRKLHT